MKFLGLKIEKAKKSYPSILRHDYQPPYYLRLMNSLSPVWLPMRQMKELNNVLNTNPILYAVLNIKAKYISNVKIGVQDLKSENIYRDERINQFGKPPATVTKMLNLVKHPNPAQNWSEFITFQSFSKDLYGNSQVYGNTLGSEVNIDNIQTIMGMWPYRMKPIMTGKYFSATQMSDIIKGWEFRRVSGTKMDIDPNLILHRKDINIDLESLEDYILGKSRAISLSRPLSTISVSYESLNVIGRERGMRVIISSKKGDTQLGSIPLEDTEKKEIQESMREYGTLEGQDQFYLTKQNIQVDQLDQDIRKLGLLEQNAADGMIVCHAYGVPEVLLKVYVQGATYENLNASEVRMYESTTKPEIESFLSDLNKWLKTEERGFKYVPLYDHIDVLREDEKAQAIVHRNVSIVERDIFINGGSTFNEWRAAIGKDKTTKWWGDMNIFEIYDRNKEYAQLILGTALNIEASRSQGGVQNDQV